MEDTRDRPLAKAIDAAGSAQALSKMIGITPQALSQWCRVPPLRVIAVETATGIPRHELRPDIYPPEARRRTDKKVRA